MNDQQRRALENEAVRRNMTVDALVQEALEQSRKKPAREPEKPLSYDPFDPNRPRTYGQDH
jgi:hypothetical protein